MSRLLMIPHAPATPLRTRSAELARALARQGRAVDLYTRALQPKGLDLGAKALWHLGQLAHAVTREELEPGLFALRLPTWHRDPRLARALEKACERWLGRAGRYTAAVSSAYGGLRFPRSPAGGPALIYDLVDDHGAGLRHAGEERAAEAAERFVARELKSAHALVVSSLVLQKLAREKHGREAALVPNGADVARIRAHSGETAASARGSRFRVGYVGGLDEFVRVDLVVDALTRLRARGVDARLSVAGRGPAIEGRRWPEWVECLGFRPPHEIPALLGSFDVGVVPFELSPFTHAALPLKVLEYGAARRLCVSSPLQELELQKLPWVRLAPLGVDEWSEALGQAADARWNEAWDKRVDEFDWAEGARKLWTVIEGVERARSG